MDNYLACIGNPLMDNTAVVDTTAVHELYGLPLDTQLEVTDAQRPIFDTIQREWVM